PGSFLSFHKHEPGCLAETVWKKVCECIPWYYPHSLRIPVSVPSPQDAASIPVELAPVKIHFYILGLAPYFSLGPPHFLRLHRRRRRMRRVTLLRLRGYRFAVLLKNTDYYFHPTERRDLF